jgi:hypothetical protein
MSPSSSFDDELALIILSMSGQNVVKAAVLSELKLKHFMTLWERRRRDRQIP